ncbi:hypothetical protein PF008_g5993 [Phytophthora fragariae]|uniref:Uncharacterized protein n=1 Tax=Phytophthora fragariae TaxID=53985 RepID=A0A6G0S7P6_9STRA|nr:hypothetical protein PF008_g5993 [Phytophthora fragariae]
MNMVRCMLFASELPLSFWGDAAEYAAYILNRSPTRANEGRKSPLEILTGRAPILQFIVVFGSSCAVFVDTNKKNLQKRSQPGQIVGKSEETKGYRVYLPQAHKVIVTRHVIDIDTLNANDSDHISRQLALEEEAESVRGAASDHGSTVKISQQLDESEGALIESSPAELKLRRSKRKRKKSRRRMEADGEAASSNRGLEGALAASAVCANDKHDTEKEPANFAAARKCAESEQWRAAEREELASLEKNNTWKVVKVPPGVRPLHTKWVYKKKRNGAGELQRYKARLVACGNEQEFGVDYLLTFAAVMELPSGKVVLAVGRIWGVPARHGDVPNAYVKAPTEEGLEIFLIIPDGMEFTAAELAELGVDDVSELGLLLGQSLYGLKQAGRLWRKLLLGFGFSQCLTDSCVYVKTDEDGITVVGTYVDDLLVTATSNARVNAFFADMAVLELKDLGRVEMFLGMRIQYDDKRGYMVDQEHAIIEMLATHGLANANSVRLPIGTGESTSDLSDELLPVTAGVDPKIPTVKDFQSLVGSLLWIARGTRPDVMFAVHRATRRTHAPTLQDWKLAKRIARYLSGTRDLKLQLLEDAKEIAEVKLCCWTDADFGGEVTDRKSVSGVIVQVQGMTVDRQCKKQTAVALSTAEAEFVAASIGGQDVLGLNELFKEIGLSVKLPIEMKMDNQAVMKQLTNEVSSSKAKHIDIRIKFLRDYVEKGVVVPTYVGSKDMLADLLTKALPSERVLALREKIGLVGGD